MTDTGKPVRNGDRFGRWTVIRTSLRDEKRAMALCRCDCGTERIVRVAYLGEKSNSCGCLRREMRTKHNDGDRQQRPKLYSVWLSMKQRCSNPNDRGYKNYGARGITVCPAWTAEYTSFKDWALSSGYEEGLHIDRIDNDGNYAPDNCRWVTPQVNANNMRANRLETLWGETKTLADWSRDPRCAVTHARLRSRLHRGWQFEKALTTPNTR